MKILVIPDIHNRYLSAQSLIDRLDYDKCILLGDYFDSYGDTWMDAENTAIWLRDKVLTNPKIVPLIGNHDTNYFWPWHPDLRCSGFTDAKRDAIRKIITQDHVNQFDFFHVESDFVFSHAGLTVQVWKDIKMNFDPYDESKETRLEQFVRILSYWIDKTKSDLLKNARVPLLEPGWDRGGRIPNGGIDWVDWSNFASVKGVNQIVGHSPHNVPEVHIQYTDGSYTKKTVTEYCKFKKEFDRNKVSINFDLDTHSNHYAIITDGQVEVWDAMYDLPISKLIQYHIPESSMGRL